MKGLKSKKQKSYGGKSKRWLILATIFLFLFFALSAVGLGIGFFYSQKIYPGIRVGSINLSRLSKVDALAKINAIEEMLQEDGLKFVAEDKEVVVNATVISAAPDLAKRIVLIDPQQTIENAYSIGRNDGIVKNSFNRLTAVLFGIRIDLVYQIDEDELIDHLQANFMELEKLPINAKLIVKNGKAEVEGEQSGYVFDYKAAAEQLDENTENLEFKTIALKLKFAEPDIKMQFTGSAVNSLENILELDNIKFVFEDQFWNLSQSRLIPWLEFQKIDGEIVIGVNYESAVEFLEGIAEDINIETKDAKLEFAGERVVEFQSSQNGRSLNIEQSYKLLNTQVMLTDAVELPLAVDIEEAKVATGDLNDLGINELLGRGTSNFSGSPVNRRHNIDVGVDSLNGVLIKPDEEFSLLDALGEIDGESGYLQELVIKAGRTIPEYGGGLCQIGSTTFRAALWSGLPITARRNHSYRVSYYEPAGMDATIYNPAPDMKFLNDTGYHVLFIAKVVGDELIFEFYGTPDGRKVTIEPNPPAVYNIVEPGPPRFIETEDLPPGVKKKVESAHNGADTYFKYTVEYADGRIEEEEFYSHYVPWRETWLIGKDPNATSTEVL